MSTHRIALNLMSAGVVLRDSIVRQGVNKDVQRGECKTT